MVRSYFTTFEFSFFRFVAACLPACLFPPAISFPTIRTVHLFLPASRSIGGRNGKKVKVPREELHICHKKKAASKRPELTREPSAIGLGRFDDLLTPAGTDLPALEDYFNSGDENNRLLRSKER